MKKIKTNILKKYLQYKGCLYLYLKSRRNKNTITFCITFPRSGHHLLINTLVKYYSGDVHFQETDGNKTSTQLKKVLNAGNLCYCEYYNHCKTYGCIDEKVNFQKNHDRRLALPKNKDCKYIIQYRHPIESIVSWYMMDNRKSSKATFELFLTQKIKFWKKFIQKWVISSDKNLTKIHLQYEDFLKDPERELIKVITFLYSETDIKIDLLRATIKEMNIQPKNDITKFEFYDEELFKKVEDGVLSELKLLNIKPLFNMSHDLKS